MEFFGYCTGGWWVTQTKPCKAQNDKPMKFDLGGAGNIKSSNQHPLANHEDGWLTDQETIFCSVSIHELTMVVG